MRKRETYETQAEIRYEGLLGIFYRLGMIEPEYANQVNRYVHRHVKIEVKTDLINKQKTTVE